MQVLFPGEAVLHQPSLPVLEPDPLQLHLRVDVPGPGQAQALPVVEVVHIQGQVLHCLQGPTFQQLFKNPFTDIIITRLISSVHMTYSILP